LSNQRALKQNKRNNKIRHPKKMSKIGMNSRQFSNKGHNNHNNIL